MVVGVAVLGSLLIPILALGLAACGLFPPIVVTIAGWRLSFTAPVTDRRIGTSVAQTNPQVITSYDADYRNISAAPVVVATMQAHTRMSKQKPNSPNHEDVRLLKVAL